MADSGGGIDSRIERESADVREDRRVGQDTDGGRRECVELEVEILRLGDGRQGEQLVADGLAEKVAREVERLHSAQEITEELGVLVVVVDEARKFLEPADAELAERSETEELANFDLVREIMEHYRKGIEFVTLLTEVNIVRRVTRRMVASILSEYHCFFQRGGSWVYDAKKLSQGFDKSKRKYLVK